MADNETIASVLLFLTGIGGGVLAYFGISKRASADVEISENKTSVLKQDRAAIISQHAWEQALSTIEFQTSENKIIRGDMIDMRSEHEKSITDLSNDLKEEKKKRKEQVAERDERITALEKMVEWLKKSLEDSKKENGRLRTENKRLKEGKIL